jgi:O-antigen/teichoic acid export membrane protein
VRNYIDKALGLATSATAKDTYILFIGNVISAFLGFLFTLIIARAISVSDFGIFSAANNLIVILTSVADLGISSGIITFVAEALSKDDKEEAGRLVKSSFIIKTAILVVVAIPLVIFSSFISKRLLASSDPKVSLWVAVITVGFISGNFFPYVLQAERKFLQAVLIDLVQMIPKVIIPLVFVFTGGLTLNRIFLAFSLSLIPPLLAGFRFIGTGFFNAKTYKKTYSKLFKYAGWIGVNRVISAISGRLDIQMLAVMTGATITGLYSIPSRLASFVIVLASSFSAVLAPRFSSFRSREVERKYLIKATLAMLPIIGGVILWILIAEPFMLLLFGTKYLPAVPAFKALTASMIPYLVAIPSTTAIIYGMKKTMYIGAYSFFQLAVIFLLNLILIPKFGVIGPTISYAVVNSILALYSWVIVYRYYWRQE